MKWPWQRRAQGPRTVRDWLKATSDKAAGQLGVQGRFESVERAGGLNIDDFFSFQGVGYSGVPVPMGQQTSERMEGDFAGLVRDGLKGNSIIWSCERLRVKVFKQARPVFQDMNDGRPGELHSSPATRLAPLQRPWTNATSSDLFSRIRLHADFGGNAYTVSRPDGKLRVLRPDWVTIVLGSDEGPGDPNDVDADVICYGYWPGGFKTGKDPVIFLPDEVAHFAPMPDPVAHYRGMSWLNPVITELMADQAATEHKLQFFRNGATMQTIVMVKEEMEETAFARFMRKMNAETTGIANAYKTVYVTGGVDAKVIGADLKQLDFKVTQGAGETRIAAAAGTPPILVGLSEGLSAGQYNIYGQAKRSYVDGEVRPDWQDLCGSLETLITPPGGSRLWYDDRDIPYLREDQKDLAEITAAKMTAITAGIIGGFEPDAVVAAVEAGDVSLLTGHHTGLYSVQLQPPSDGTMESPPALPAPNDPAAGSTPPLNGKTPPKKQQPAMAGTGGKP